jgi:hypothetical protein
LEDLVDFGDLDTAFLESTAYFYFLFLSDDAFLELTFLSDFFEVLEVDFSF